MKMCRFGSISLKSKKTLQIKGFLVKKIIGKNGTF